MLKASSLATARRAAMRALLLQEKSTAVIPVVLPTGEMLCGSDCAHSKYKQNQTEYSLMFSRLAFPSEQCLRDFESACCSAGFVIHLHPHKVIERCSKTSDMGIVHGKHGIVAVKRPWFYVTASYDMPDIGEAPC